MVSSTRLSIQVCFGRDGSSAVTSLDFWVCLLVMSLGIWGLLLGPVFGHCNCLSSEVRDGVGATG